MSCLFLTHVFIKPTNWIYPSPLGLLNCPWRAVWRPGPRQKGQQKSETKWLGKVWPSLAVEKGEINQQQSSHVSTILHHFTISFCQISTVWWFFLKQFVPNISNQQGRTQKHTPAFHLAVPRMKKHGQRISSKQSKMQHKQSWEGESG